MSSFVRRNLSNIWSSGVLQWPKIEKPLVLCNFYCIKFIITFFMVFAPPRSETFRQPYSQKQKLKSTMNSPEQHTLLVKTLSGNNFHFDFSYVIIFVTWRKICHFLPTKNFTISIICEWHIDLIPRSNTLPPPPRSPGPLIRRII